MTLRAILRVVNVADAVHAQAPARVKYVTLDFEEERLEIWLRVRDDRYEHRELISVEILEAGAEKEGK